MTTSHTASLAGGNAASEAFFDATGVGVVHSIEELLGGWVVAIALFWSD